MSDHNPRAGLRERFCAEQFLLSRVHTWSGVVCLVPMTRKRFARIELVTQGTSDTYEALHVRIVHQDKGKLDDLTFAFDDHLLEREDARSDYRGPMAVCLTEARTRFDWYIARPSSVARQRMMRAIDRYIEGFER